MQRWYIGDASIVAQQRMIRKETLEAVNEGEEQKMMEGNGEAIESRYKNGRT